MLQIFYNKLPISHSKLQIFFLKLQENSANPFTVNHRWKNKPKIMRVKNALVTTCSNSKNWVNTTRWQQTRRMFRFTLWLTHCCAKSCVLIKEKGSSSCTTAWPASKSRTRTDASWQTKWDSERPCRYLKNKPVKLTIHTECSLDIATALPLVSDLKS